MRASRFLSRSISVAVTGPASTPHLLITAALLALSACGGGGGPNPLPPPPPAPPPPPPPPPATPAAVTIFASPTPTTYATVGASLSGSSVYFDDQNARYGPLSTAESDQPVIRYSSAGFYEIDLPDADFARLVHMSGVANPTDDTPNLQPSGRSDANLYVSLARRQGYKYSEMGLWSNPARSGALAFGVPTPLGAVPQSGSAVYSGLVLGTVDILQMDNLAGAYAASSVDGFVSMNFDFGSGSLSGSLSLFTPDGMQPLKLGEFTFKDTVFSVGSTTYSGRFDSSAVGQNFFFGRFTGPNAEETIGAWAVPFVFSKDGQTIKADGKTHQAFGSWIARRGGPWDY